jgi:hypothetical protein
MKRTIQAVLIAAALAAPAFAPLAARADVSVTFDSGSVAYGYNDGYWDRSHAWHAWPNTAAQHEWSERNREHYFDQRHDRDHDMGWRTDRWWDHH